MKNNNYKDNNNYIGNNKKPDKTARKSIEIENNKHVCTKDDQKVQWK